MESLRVRHDWATSLSLFTFIHWRRKWQPTPVFLPGESQGQRSLSGLPSVGSHRVGHDWSDLAAAAAAAAAAASSLWLHAACLLRSSPVLLSCLLFAPRHSSTGVYMLLGRTRSWCEMANSGSAPADQYSLGPLLSVFLSPQWATADPHLPREPSKTCC